MVRQVAFLGCAAYAKILIIDNLMRRRRILLNFCLFVRVECEIKATLF